MRYANDHRSLCLLYIDDFNYSISFIFVYSNIFDFIYSILINPQYENDIYIHVYKNNIFIDV